MSDRTPKTHQQWHNLRRKNPRRFYSTEAQKLKLEDAKALGSEQFFHHEPTGDEL